MTAQAWIVLILALLGGYWFLTKVIILMFVKQLDKRFDVQELSRKTAQDAWESRFKNIEELARQTDRDLLLMRGDIPNQYVRRDDYIRGQSIIESKLDAIANELKMVQIKGNRNGS